MPLIEVVHVASVDDAVLHELARTLPHAVSLAVECPEEPYDGHLQTGDVEVRFRERSRLDPPGLDLVVEVRSKWTASREESRDERCDRIRDAVLTVAGACSVGVYLSLPVAGWSQSG